jgi:hypothetical protein
MPSRTFFAVAIADALFLVSGGILLGFSLIGNGMRDGVLTAGNGEEATIVLLYQRFPLLAATINAALIITVFVLTLPGLLMTTSRGWLKIGAVAVAACGLFTLCLGVVLWVMTLTLRDDFSSVYMMQDPETHKLIQTSFNCCGYDNSTSPAHVTNPTCPSPAAAALNRGCATYISSFANGFIDKVFTAMFGVVGVDALLILAIACLLKERKESARYRIIDQKTGYRNI